MDVKKKANDENATDTLIKSLIPEEDERNFNGLLITKNYVPEELLTEILYYVDYKQLVICHLVCKKWDALIKKYIWRKKAEAVSGQTFPNDDKIPWTAYYFVCNKRPFNRNLLLSANVTHYNNDEFKIVKFDKDDPNPPINVLPFPEDAIHGGKVTCIVTPRDHRSYECQRKLVIDLIKEGFTEFILDHLQPVVKISEWYCCEWKETEADYSCSIKLLKSNELADIEYRIIRSYYFNKSLQKVERRGQWFKFSYEFKNYGKGLRNIKFYDGGRKNVIMAGACVKLVMPVYNENKNKKE